MALEHYFEVVEKKEKPNFQRAKENKLLDEKIKEAEKLVENCGFCERKCNVNRRQGRSGWCRVSYESRISSAFVHMGEEIELIPSGTIFFSGCNFHCVYCQNYDISQKPEKGSIWNPQKIADWIEKNEAVIKNVNLVGGEPTPNLHHILKALKLCNVYLPIVWNSNMYMSLEAMKLLEGVVDLYLADFRYGNSECAEKLSRVKNYFEIVSRNHKIAAQHASVLIRQLVLPNHTECCSKKVLLWIKENLGNDAVINIMSQYRPMHLAHGYAEINRFLTMQEYNDVVGYARRIGLKNLEIQGVYDNLCLPLK